MTESRPAPLNRERILEAALTIIDRDGLPQLSMRHIGAELGVEAMALYRYYPQKDAILMEVVDQVIGQPEYPHTGTWQQSVRLLATELRRRVLAHPNAMPLVASRWLQGRTFRNILDQARAEMGASSVDVDSLLHAVMCLLLGYCWLEVGAFVGTMPEDGGLTRSSIRAEQLLDTEDAGAGWLATERFLVELDFLLRGATTRESNDA